MHPGFATQSQLVFAGSVEEEILNGCRALEGLDVVYHGRVNHGRSLQLMMDASLLLNCLPETDEARLFITGKMMEYLATGHPVMSTGPLDGDAAALLRETSNSKMFLAEDTAGMAAFVDTAFRKWLKGEPNQNTSLDRIKAYSRLETARALAAVIKGL
jgi:hypothetical protein